MREPVTTTSSTCGGFLAGRRRSGRRLSEGRSRESGHDAREDRRAEEVLALDLHVFRAPTEKDADAEPPERRTLGSDCTLASKAVSGQGIVA